MVTTSNVKEYLDQFERINKSFDIAAESLDGLRKIDLKIEKNLLKPNVKLTDIVDQSTELREQINEDYANLLMLKSEFIKTINEISDLNQRKVITLRYVDLLPWGKISTVLHSTNRKINRIHGAALLALVDIFNKREPSAEQTID